MYRIDKLLSTDKLNEYSLCGIRNHEPSGIIVRKLLTEDEVNTIVKQLGSHPDKVLVEDMINTYPMAFSQAAQALSESQKLEEYFLDCKELPETIAQQFSVDLFGRLRIVFDALAIDLSFRLFPGVSGRGALAFGTFRELLPGKGELKVHCENLFFNEFKDFFSHQAKYVNLSNPVSYFILLQKPDEGGELELFDALWGDYQLRVNDNTIKDAAGTAHDLSSIKKQSIDMEPGDLIVFSGGNIWHRVSKVTGGKSRISFGGFISFNDENQRVYCWS